MDSSPIDTRTEILFLYDVSDANPNGDPNDENRPRMDLESGRAKVSDVRMKRTIRDYLHEYCGLELFCREIEKDDGSIQEGKDRAEDFYKKIAGEARLAENVHKKKELIEQRVIQQCIDVRLFGATIPVAATKRNEKDSSITLTGAVQFAMGTSLHRLEPKFIKGTGAFASGQGKEQRTFREEYVLPYALIAFYGVVNQQAAKTTRMTTSDAEKLFEAVWYGTKNLITRSKFGQRPLLLLLVEYSANDSNSYIGRLDRFLQLKAADGEQRLRDEELRDVAQVLLDLDGLMNALAERRTRISRIRFAWDPRLRLSSPPVKCNGSWKFLGFEAENLEFS